jgi:8-oxo-dGTP pyrophosphatase MutT (NUDIX family)
MEIQDKELHKIALTAIIYKKRGADLEYLITQRSSAEEDFKHRWHVPGGKLSADDYMNAKPTTKEGQWYNVLDSTLRREVREEVNLEIQKPEYLLDLVFINKKRIPVVVLSYYAEYESGEVKLDEDSMDYKWVTLKEAKNYDLIAGIWEEIEMVDKILKNK